MLNQVESIFNVLSNLFKYPFILLQMILFSILFLLGLLLIILATKKQKPRSLYELFSGNETLLIRFSLLICVAISIGFDLYFFSFITDDAFITFRYSKNLANGEGIVFNSSNENPVEGYSNFLWVLINTIPIFLNWDIVIWVKSLSIFISIFSILILYNFACLFYPKKIALIAPLFYSIYYPFHIWTIGGLETPLFVLLLISGTYFAYIESNNSQKFPKFSVIFLALLTLTRPEGILYFGAIEGFLLIYYLFIRKEKVVFFQRIISLFIVGVIYIIYFIWSFTYYGQIFPNSYVAKGSSSIITSAGMRYLGFFLIFTIPIIILMGVGILKILVEIEGKILQHKSFKIMSFLAVPILVNFIIILNISAFNAAQGFRFALPAMPFIILLAVYPFKRLRKMKIEEIISLDLNLKQILFSLIPFISVIGMIILPISAPLVYKNTSNTDVNDKYYNIAKWIDKYVPEDELIAFTDMGIIPYYTENEYLDMWGLMDEHIAEEGFDIDYVLDEGPILIILKEISNTKKIRDDKEFQTNYELFYTLKLKETTQYLEEQEYDLWIYKTKDFDISNTTIDKYF